MSCEGERKPGTDDFLVSTLRFTVPLRHNQPDGEKIRLVGRIIHAERSPETGYIDWEEHPKRGSRCCRTWNAAQGPSHHAVSVRWARCRQPVQQGPGYESMATSKRVSDLVHGLPRLRGEDSISHRGRSSARGLRTDKEKADYIKLFCQENIVRDLEAVRLCLSKKPSRRPAAARPPGS